jgi:pyruvate dehydrogenase E2 component (dihydrolipoamide acetyltransferase)
MSTFTLPDLGEGVREAELVAWSVTVGDHVVADQPLVSVETDKAVVEIPAPYSGEVRAVHGAPGDIVKVGAPLVEIETGERKDKGAVVGELPEAKAETRAEIKAAAKAPARPAEKPAQAAAVVRAAPAARKLAAELGVELSGVAGEGPGGTVTLAQVRSLAAGAGEGLRGPRRAMAAAMSRARDEVSPATLTEDADISGWGAKADPTVRLVQALAAGCKASPVLNAWFEGEALTLKRSEAVDLAIAVDTEEGLFAPVLRGAEALSAAKIRKGVSALVEAVRARTNAPEDLKGATITLSNFGMIGGRYAQLVVSPPQVAILGAGVIAERPAVRKGKLVAARIMPLSLTFDHRAVTGGEAVRFMAAVKAHLERKRA